MRPIGHLLLSACVLDPELWAGLPRRAGFFVLLCALTMLVASAISGFGMARLLVPAIPAVVAISVSIGWSCLQFNLLRFMFANASASPSELIVPAGVVAHGSDAFPAQLPAVEPRPRAQRLLIIVACALLGITNSPLLLAAVSGNTWLIPVVTPSVDQRAGLARAAELRARVPLQSGDEQAALRPRDQNSDQVRSGASPAKPRPMPATGGGLSSVTSRMALIAASVLFAALFSAAGWLRMHPLLWLHDRRTGMRDRDFIMDQYTHYLAENEAALQRGRAGPDALRRLAGAVAQAYVDPPFNMIPRAQRPPTRARGAIREILPQAALANVAVSGLFSVVYETDNADHHGTPVTKTPLRRILRVDVVAGRYVPGWTPDEMLGDDVVRFDHLGDASFQPVGGEHLSPYRETLTNVLIERPVVNILRKNGRRLVARMDGWGVATIRLDHVT